LGGTIFLREDEGRSKGRGNVQLIIKDEDPHATRKVKYKTSRSCGARLRDRRPNIAGGHPRAAGTAEGRPQPLQKEIFDMLEISRTLRGNEDRVVGGSKPGLSLRRAMASGHVVELV